MPAMALRDRVWAMEKLAGTDGSRWALLKFTYIPTTATAETAMLKRWRLVQTPLFGVFVHCHYKPDAGGDLHDHPYSFWSWVLRGDYSEYRQGGLIIVWRQGSWHYMKAEWPHSIRALSRRPTWTLVFLWRRRRDWGFHTDNGWIPHKEYERLNDT
jgi:hypothetical protein